MFDNERDFENALIKMLFEKGWDRTVIKNPTEEDLSVFRIPLLH